MSVVEEFFKFLGRKPKGDREEHQTQREIEALLAELPAARDAAQLAINRAIGQRRELLAADVEEMVGLLDEAGRKENDFSKLLDANGVKWKENSKVVLDTNQALLVIADLVQRAATYSQAVKIAEWAGYSKEAVPFLRQGAAAIEDMARSAPVVSEELARQRADFAREWAQTISQWTSWFKTAVIEITKILQPLVDFASHLVSGLAEGFKNIAIGVYNSSPAIEKAGEEIKALAAKFEDASKQALQGADTFTGAFAAAARAAYAFGGAAKSGPTTKLAPDDDKKGQADAIRASMEAAQERVKIADLEYQQKVELLDAEYKRHEITEQEKTATTLYALNKRHAAEGAAINAELATEGLSKSQHQRLVDELLTIDKKYQLDQQKVIDQGISEQEKKWDELFKTIESGFNSQLRGLLAGTTTWSNAMKSLLGDLLIKFIETEERELFKHIATEAAKTTATTTGVAARTAAETAGASVGITAQIGNALGTIAADAAKTFAGIFAFLSPVMGPAAAGPAAAGEAAVTAADAAIPSADVGGYVLQSGLAMIHAGETVTPASMAQPYSGGGSSPTTINFAPNLSAFNPQGLQELVNRMMPQFMRAMNSYKALNPSTQ